MSCDCDAVWNWLVASSWPTRVYEVLLFSFADPEEDLKQRQEMKKKTIKKKTPTAITAR